MKKSFAILALALALAPIGVAAKSDVMDQNRFVYIPKEQTVSGNVYRAGEQIQIDGSVDGDVIVAGGLIKINGTVNGDVIAAGGRVIINGPVLGNVRVAAGQIDLNSVVGKNVTLAGGNILINKSAAIGYEAMIFGGQVDIDGQIKKDLRGKFGQLTLAGNVGNDVWVGVQQLVLQPTAMIGGNLTYVSARAADVLSGAVVKGEVNYQMHEVGSEIDPVKAGRAAMVLFIVLVVVKWIGLWLLALLMLWMVPKKVEKSMRMLDHGVWPALGIGLIAFLGVPVAAVILAMTVIGLQIAAVLFCLYMLALIFATILISTYVGEWIIKRLTNRHWRGVSLRWASLLGLFLMMALGLVPFIGWLIIVLGLALGLGALLQFEQQEMRRWR